MKAVCSYAEVHVDVQLGSHKLSPEQGLIVICACVYTVNVFE